MIKYENELKNYASLNKNVKEGGAVFFGCDSLHSVPVSEITQDMNLNISTYNRSINGLVIADAESVANECIYRLNPSKLFVNIGENDISDAEFNIESFIEKYEWFLYNVHSKCKCSIYIISVSGRGADDVNARLRELARHCRCEFLEISDGGTPVNFIRKTKCFLRNGHITFPDAMAIYS